MGDKSSKTRMIYTYGRPATPWEYAAWPTNTSPARQSRDSRWDGMCETRRQINPREQQLVPSTLDSTTWYARLQFVKWDRQPSLEGCDGIGDNLLE